MTSEGRAPLNGGAKHLMDPSKAMPHSNGSSNANRRSVSPKSTSSLPSQQNIRKGDGKASSPAKPIQNGSGPQSSSSAGAPLNPRSCVTCRKRKVRCDKRHPCANCARASTECIFPGPGRAPRRSRKNPDTELLARLRRLEGVVKNMGKDPEEAAESADNASKSGADDSIANKDPGRDPSEKLAKDFGRLVIEEGRSRYVSNKFWTALSEEVAEMRDILDDPTDDEQDYPSPGSASVSSASTNGQGFLFNFSSTAHSLRNFHPPAREVPMYWRIFKENVDPVLRIFHRPTTEKLVIEVTRNLDHMSKTTEAVMFSIYYSVVNSMSPEDCVAVLGLDKDAGLKKYRFAFEQSLARANLLSTQEMEILQSLTLFLCCARRSDDTRYVWTLAGLLIRLATALGIHRDGSHFNLPPFEIEMRRRLWWHICNLDVRSSEDHGINPSLVEANFDTKFPSNINDEDISPSTLEMPKEHQGWTETTFDLIRYSIATTVRRLSHAPAGAKKSARPTMEDKERIIEELHQYITKKYLIYCDLSVPINWVAATVTRLIMAKMWLVVHHPLMRPDRGAGLPKETIDHLFLTSLEVIEFSRLLETENATRRWGWIFASYQQWHAMAYLLSQLTVRTKGPEVERAWAVVDVIFQEWHTGDTTAKKGMLWKPLRKMMARARVAREEEQRKQKRFPLDGSIGPAAAPIAAMAPVEVMPGITNTSNPLDYTTMLPFVHNPTQTIYMESNGQQQQDLHGHGQQQQHGLQTALNLDHPAYQPEMTGNVVDQWLMNEANYPQEPWGDAGAISWAEWDDMLKDFQVEGGFDNQVPIMPATAGGLPMAGSVTNWW